MFAFTAPLYWDLASDSSNNSEAFLYNGQPNIFACLILIWDSLQDNWLHWQWLVWKIIEKGSYDTETPNKRWKKWFDLSNLE